MKKTALLFIALISGYFSYAQKGYIGLHFGSSNPTGDFASKDINNKNAGFAKQGMMAELTMGYTFNSNFGIAGSVRGQLNQTDDASYAARARAEKPETTWTAKSNAWGMTAIMIGPYASFNLTEKLNLDLRVLGGYAWVGCPTVTYNTTHNGKDSWTEQAGTKTNTISYLAGAQLRYTFGEWFSLMAGVDYYGANPEWKKVEVTSYEGNTTYSSFKQPYSTVNFSVGLGVSLGVE